MNYLFYPKKRTFFSLGLAFFIFFISACASMVESTPRDVLVGPLAKGAKWEDLDSALRRTSYIKGEGYTTSSRVSITARTPLLLKFQAGEEILESDYKTTLEEGLCFGFKLMHTSYWLKEGEKDPVLDWSQWKFSFSAGEKNVAMDFFEKPECEVKKFKEVGKESVRNSYSNLCTAKLCTNETFDLLKPFLVKLEFTKSKDIIPLEFGWNGPKN